MYGKFYLFVLLFSDKICEVANTDHTGNTIFSIYFIFRLVFVTNTASLSAGKFYIHYLCSDISCNEPETFYCIWQNEHNLFGGRSDICSLVPFYFQYFPVTDNLAVGYF